MPFVLMLPTIFCLVTVARKKSTNTEVYSYDYNYNGCATGKHNFESGTELCDGLENKSLNNYFAVESCRTYYQKNRNN